MRIAILSLFLLAACATEEQQEQPEPAPEAATQAPAPVNQEAASDPEQIVFAPELGVDLDAMELQESGLYIQVLQEGDGPQATAGDQMGVDYTVWLPDGSKLDSSFDHQPAAPLPMVLGRTRLIDGWTEGVTGMRLGEKRRLVLPYDLAYGEQGRPGIPPYTPLLFEVELTQHVPAGGE